MRADYVTRRFNALSAELKSSWGCTFVETALSAISGFQPQPRVNQNESLSENASHGKLLGFKAEPDCRNATKDPLR